MTITDTFVVFIVGPTAVGKSALALHLALKFVGEIVNADSRQVYRSMDIGTAKPSLEERSQIPHHLIDILDPDQDFSVALFLQLASDTIHDIHNRRKLPIVVGGTGQYVWALLEGWQVPRVPPKPELRAELEARAQKEGRETLYHELLKIDREAAAKINHRNLRRVIRALEIYYSTGMPPSKVQHKQPPPYRPLIIGLTTDREDLYRRIDRRVDEMLQRGLVHEVQDLLKKGYSPNLPCMASIGYREIVFYLQGQLPLSEAVRRIKFETHRFARHQYAWFRPKDPRITWLKAGPDVAWQAEPLVERFLGKGLISQTPT